MQSCVISTKQQCILFHHSINSCVVTQGSTKASRARTKHLPASAAEIELPISELAFVNKGEKKCAQSRNVHRYKENVSN